MMLPGAGRSPDRSPAAETGSRQSILFEVYLLLACATGIVLLVAGGIDAALAWPLGMLPYLGRNLYYLVRLAGSIRRHRRIAPPFPRGLWGDIFRAVGQYRQLWRKRRKRQIRFARRFREAVLSIPDALAMLDGEQRIEWANPAAAALMDVHWPADKGKRLTEILNYPQLAELIEAGEHGRSVEVTPEHNRTLTLSLRIAPFGERRHQRLAVGRDITKVFHLDMIRRDFMANASHELRTPLTVIAGFIENLADSPITPESHRRPLDLMRNQTERMRSIIEDVLTLSRLEMDDRCEEVAPVDVPEELGPILHEAEALSGGRHELVADIDADLLVVGSQPELRSAFANLVFNAVKHTPPGSRIRVTWRKDERGPLFSVQDNGGGIAPEHIPRLTERFYRVDKARFRTSGGTGLGLTIVKHVLNRHDARLIVASEAGQGATFTCRFPGTSALYRPQIQIGPAASVSAA